MYTSDASFEYRINDNIQSLVCKKEDMYFLLDLVRGSFLQIDRISYEIFKKMKMDNDDWIYELEEEFPNDCIKQKIKDLKQAISEMKLFQERKYNGEEKKFKNLWLHLTNSCNLRCKYCFHNDNKEIKTKDRMSIEIAKKAVDYFFANSNEKMVTVTFIGGEPLIEFSLIKSIIEYINTIEKEKGILVKYSITTNGTYITDEIARFLGENNVSVSISIDGDEAINDESRKHCNGTGSYQKTIQGYENLRRYCQLITARVTLTRENIKDYTKIVQHLFGIGFDSVAYQFVATSLDELIIRQDELEIFKEQYTSAIKNFKIDLENYQFKILDRAVGWMQRIYSKPVRNECTLVSSGKVVVDTEGNLYRCEKSLGNEKFIIGNIEEGIDEQKYTAVRAPRLKNRMVCKTCYLKNYCDGGCYYSAYLKNGTLEKPLFITCEEIKFTFIKSLELFIDLYKNNSELVEMLFGDVFTSKEEIKHEFKNRVSCNRCTR